MPPFHSAMQRRVVLALMCTTIAPLSATLPSAPLPVHPSDGQIVHMPMPYFSWSDVVPWPYHGNAYTINLTCTSTVSDQDPIHCQVRHSLRTPGRVSVHDQHAPHIHAVVKGLHADARLHPAQCRLLLSLNDVHTPRSRVQNQLQPS
jgi:hypothetical protein